LTTLTSDEASAIEQRRKRHILRVVAKVVAEEGFSGATMRKIAERAGVSTGMLTYYYKNKRELLQDMLAATYAGFVRDLGQIIGDEPGPERIQAAFQVMFNGQSSGRFPISFWLSYFAEAIRDGELREASVRGILRLREVFRSAIASGKETGEVRDDVDAEAIADLFMVMWQGLRVQVGLYEMPEERASDVVIQTLRLLRPR
jgi:AcrR family transcriptional regulator